MYLFVISVGILNLISVDTSEKNAIIYYRNKDDNMLFDKEFWFDKGFYIQIRIGKWNDHYCYNKPGD